MTLDLTNATMTELLFGGTNPRFTIAKRETIDEFKEKTREKITLMDINNLGHYEGIVEIATKEQKVTSTKTFHLIKE
jgi:hypothetical protein